MDRDKLMKARVGAFAAGAFLAALVTWHLGMRWPPEGVLWVGQTGIIASVAALAAFIGIVVNVAIASRNLRQARRTERATRFQKGVELLTSTHSPAARVGAVTILRDLGDEDSSTYLLPIFRTLATLVEEAGRPVFVGIRTSGSADLWPGFSDPVPDAALAAITNLPDRHRWPQLLQGPNGRAQVLGASFINTRVQGYDFTGLALHDAMMSDVTFVGCTFRDFETHALVRGVVVFEQCTFDNCRLSVFDEAGSTDLQSASFRLRFSNDSHATDVTVNGEALAIGQ